MAYIFWGFRDGLRRFSRHNFLWFNFGLTRMIFRLYIFACYVYRDFCFNLILILYQLLIFSFPLQCPSFYSLFHQYSACSLNCRNRILSLFTHFQRIFSFPFVYFSYLYILEMPQQYHLSSQSLNNESKKTEFPSCMSSSLLFYFYFQHSNFK